MGVARPNGKKSSEEEYLVYIFVRRMKKKRSTESERTRHAYDVLK